MNVRAETNNDWPAVYDLNLFAFDMEAEANLVDVLRNCATPHISLVAEIEDEIVGHIMFSPVELSGCSSAFIMGLAPMAVKENFRGIGVGSKLVESGIEACKKLEVGAVVVLGHSRYYPKFGFNPAFNFNLSCEYDVPAEYFMAMELNEGSFDDVSGEIKYHPAFSEL